MQTSNPATGEDPGHSFDFTSVPLVQPTAPFTETPHDQRLNRVEVTASRLAYIVAVVFAVGFGVGVVDMLWDSSRGAEILRLTGQTVGPIFGVALGYYFSRTRGGEPGV